MKAFANKRFKRITTFTAALILMVSTFTAFGPLFLSQSTEAITTGIYDGIPSAQPPSYPSLGYQATSTKEFGDHISLGGTNRQLENVTVSLTDWACENDYTKPSPSDPCVTTPGSSFNHPITINLYEVSGGAVGDLIASKTQTVAVPYRPSADPTCDTPTQWRNPSTDTCHNGFAFNANFNFAADNEILPNEVIATVVYNTQSYGVSPIGSPGPYNSLNVSLAEVGPTVGTDVDSDVMFWNTSYGPFYTDGGAGGVGTLRADTNWSPYHLAIEINADAVEVATPTNLRLNGDKPCGFATSTNFITPTWDAAAGADHYNYRVVLPNGSTYGPVNVGNVTSVSGSFGGEGLSTFAVQTVDAFGNTSEWAEPCAVYYDPTAPVAPVNGQPETTPTNDFFFTWDDVTDDGSPIVEYQFQASLSSSSSAGVLNSGVWKNWENGSGDQSFLSSPTIHSVGAPDGVWYWQVRAIDAAGNVGAWSEIWDTLIDSQVPTADLIFDGIGPAYTGFKVQYSEAVNVGDAENPANYYLSNWPGAGGSGDLVGDANISYDPVTHLATIDFGPPFHFGEWYISAEQLWGVENVHDLAGNTLLPTSEHSSPMVKPNVVIDPQSSPTTNTTLNWNWSGSSDPGGIEASGIKNYEYAFNKQGEVETWVSTTNTTLDTTVTSDGLYELRVRAFDNAGNVSDIAVSTVIVDTSEVDVEVDSLSTTTNTPTITGTINDPTANITLTIDGGATTLNATNNGDGTWSYTFLTPIADGSYTIDVTATDAVNSADTDTASASLVVNTTPAPAPTPENPNPAPVTTTTVTPLITNPAAAAVLGIDTDATGTEGAADIEGASTLDNLGALDTDPSDGSIYGLAWYWWLLIIGAIIALIWAIIAAVRRRNQEA